MPPLRKIVALSSPAPKRLRRYFDALIAVKRRRAFDDPELFAAYRTLAQEAQSVVAAHVDELVSLTSAILRAGIEEGAFRKVDPATAARSLLLATTRFHHPVHAAEWTDPGIDEAFDQVWRLLMDGLRVPKGLGSILRLNHPGVEAGKPTRPTPRPPRATPKDASNLGRGRIGAVIGP
jgi:hypothetical protein